MKNKTLLSFMIAGACITGAANEAMAHHHGDKTAHRMGAVGGLLHGAADVVGALTGRPAVVAPVVAPAPAVVAPVVAPAPAVVAPAPAVVAPVVAPAPAVVAPVVAPTDHKTIVAGYICCRLCTLCLCTCLACY